MEALHSTFLQSLGISILDSLWQFALLWLVYELVQLIFTFTSTQKYRFALLTSFAGFVWFIGSFIFHLQIQNTNPLQIFFTTGSNTTFYFPNSPLLDYLSLSYLGILFLLAMKWALSFTTVIKIRKEGLVKIPVEWRLFVNQLNQHLSIHKKVSIFLSSVVDTPMTIGYLKPIILIPIASLNHLTKEQMEAVILHEMAHIKRMDYLFNLLLSIAETILYFNPFMHLLCREVKTAREHCCDDLVLQFEYQPATYANALLSIATASQNEFPKFALHATNEKKYLLARIKRIVGKNESYKMKYKHQLIALLMLSIYFFSFHQSNSNQKNIRSTYTQPNTKHSNAFLQSNILYPANVIIETHKQRYQNVSTNVKICKSNTETLLQANEDGIRASNQTSDNANIYHQTSDNEAEIKFIKAINHEQQNINVLKIQLSNDVKLATEQARLANKQLDAITLKTMMLARVRKMIAENENETNRQEVYNQRELILLERKLAYDLLNNVIESDQCKIEKAKDKIIFHYYLPEDDNGNNYSFEYIINQNNNETIENNLAEKQTENGHATEEKNKRLNTDTLLQHHLKTIRI